MSRTVRSLIAHNAHIARRALLIPVVSLAATACQLLDPTSPLPERDVRLRPTDRVMVDTLPIQLDDVSTEQPVFMEPREIERPHPTPLPMGEDSRDRKDHPAR